MDGESTPEQQVMRRSTLTPRSPPGGNMAGINSTNSTPSRGNASSSHSARQEQYMMDRATNPVEDANSKKRQLESPEQPPAQRPRDVGESLVLATDRGTAIKNLKIVADMAINGRKNRQTYLTIPRLDILDRAVSGLEALIPKLFDEIDRLKSLTEEKTDQQAVSLSQEQTFKNFTNELKETLVSEVKASCNELIQAAHRKAEALQPGVSYSQAAAKPAQLTNIKPSSATVLCYPREDGASSEATKELIQRMVSPRTLGVQVSRLAKIRDGGVAIEVATLQQADKLLKSLEGVVKASLPRKRLPKMQIFDVPSDISPEDLVESIRVSQAQDTPPEIFRDKLKFICRTGPRGQPTTNMVFEAAPDFYNEVLSLGRIFMMWTSHKVRPFFGIARCFKCQRYGHISKNCHATQDTCGHCTRQGHTHHDCPTRRLDPTCPNCPAGRNKHSVASPNCPALEREKQRIIQLTDYGP